MAQHKVIVQLSPSEQERVLDAKYHAIDRGCVVITGSFQQCVDQYVELDESLQEQEEPMHTISLPDRYCIKIMRHKDWFQHADKYRLEMTPQSDDTFTLKFSESFIPICLPRATRDSVILGFIGIRPPIEMVPYPEVFMNKVNHQRLEDCVVGEGIEDTFTSCDWFNVAVIEVRSVFEIMLKPNSVSNENWNSFHDSLQVICNAIPSRWAQLSSLEDSARDSVYLVKFNGEWHRAQQAGGNKSYLLDIGQVVESDCIVQPCCQLLLSRCPFLVRDCMLDRVDQPCGDGKSDDDDPKWSDEANNAFRTVLKRHEDGLQCRFTRMVPFGKHRVCLVDFRSHRCPSIAQAFVETGYATGF